MLLLAWEAGLDGVSEEAADLLLLALEVCPRTLHSVRMLVHILVFRTISRMYYRP